MGEFKGGFVLHAEKWAFISRRLKYRVGKIRNNRNFRIIGQGNRKKTPCFKISKL